MAVGGIPGHPTHWMELKMGTCYAIIHFLVLLSAQLFLWWVKVCLRSLHSTIFVHTCDRLFPVFQALKNLNPGMRSPSDNKAISNIAKGVWA